MRNIIINNPKFYRLALKAFCFGALTVFPGCHQNQIPLQKVTQTSDLIYCDKVFAEDRKALVEMNEILVQIGRLDSLDIDTVKAAVIRVGNNETILDVEKIEQDGETITEAYSGKGYKMILKYETVKEYYTTTYKGRLEIWKGDLHSEFKVAGLNSSL